MTYLVVGTYYNETQRFATEVDAESPAEAECLARIEACGYDAITFAGGASWTVTAGHDPDSIIAHGATRYDAVRELLGLAEEDADDTLEIAAVLRGRTEEETKAIEVVA
jgi:hypothetical protein